MAPEVSVVMPNYNKEQFIGWAIKSVISQTFANLELVVVDDASTDSSVEIVREALKSDGRIRLVSNSRNLGVAASRNRGIRASVGRIVTFIDSDDLFSPDRIQRQLELGRSQGEEKVIYTTGVTIGPDVSSLNKSQANRSTRPSGWILAPLLSGRVSPGAVLTLPRACLETVGLFEESIVWGEDLELCLRLAARYQFEYDPRATYAYRIYGQNTINRISKKERWRQQSGVLEKHLIKNVGALDANSIKQSFDYLFSCYVASGQWSKILRYGFATKEGFESMVGLPFRALRD